MRLRPSILIESNGSRQVRTVKVRHWNDDVVLRLDLHPLTTGAIGSDNYTRHYQRTGWDGLTGLPLYTRRTARS